MSNGLPLASMKMGCQDLRLADGPGEVQVLIARNALGRHASGESWHFGN